MLNKSSYDRIGLPLLTCGLIGVAIFLPWRTFITNMLIIASAAAWVLYIKNNKEYFREARFFILLLTLVYIVEVLGMIHTDNISYGLHRLESKLSLIVFPLIVLGSGLNKIHIGRILTAFVASTVAASLYLTCYAVAKLVSDGRPFSDFITNPEYSNVALTEPLQRIHPTFLTLFICLALFVTTDYVRVNHRRYWLIGVNVFLVLFAVQLASRAGYAALVCTLVFIGFGLIGLKRKWLLVFYSSLIIATVSASVFFLPSVKSRLVDTVIEADINKEQMNSVTYHFRAWTCSIESWLNNHILFGHGTGDEVDTITKCYHEKQWLGYGHDAHNEFLSSLVKHGLVGLVTLLVSFFYPFFLAFKYRNLRYVAFLTIVLISFLAESMLRGQTGLVFFTLFNSLFLKEMLLQNNVLNGPLRAVAG
jgi:O-antigen ligase